MDIKAALIIALYKILSEISLKSDNIVSVKLPCGSELTVKIVKKKKLEIVKVG